MQSDIGEASIHPDRLEEMLKLIQLEMLDQSGEQTVRLLRQVSGSRYSSKEKLTAVLVAVPDLVRVSEDFREKWELVALEGWGD